MIRLVTLFSLALATLLFQPAAHATATTDQKAVLVTGASSGLGRVMAETMAAQGYFVYAGARKSKDLAELNKIENVQAVRLDVNKPEQIGAAVHKLGVRVTGQSRDTVPLL